MSEPKLGTILEIEQPRDAIHFAIALVEAGEILYPGQHVGLAEHLATSKVTAIGIVDPFLKERVMPKQIFWLMLYPKTVTGMRHEWEHPSFGKTTQAVSSERWLREYAESVGLSFDALMRATESWIDSGQTYCFSNTSCQYIPDEYWSHYENYTGKSVAQQHKDNFFTCSC